MHSLMMMLWLSLIIVLNVQGQAVMDYSRACEQCNQNNMPECSRDDIAKQNSTINCPQTDGTSCVIGVVESNDTAFSLDSLCLVVESSPSSSNLLSEELQNAHTSTVLPLSLAHQMVTTESELQHLAQEPLDSGENLSVPEMPAEADEEAVTPNDIINHEGQEAMSASHLDETDDLQLEKQVVVVGPSDHQDDAPNADAAQNSISQNSENNKNAKTPVGESENNKEVIQVTPADLNGHTSMIDVTPEPTEQEGSHPNQFAEHSSEKDVGDAHMDLGMSDASKSDQLEMQGNSVALGMNTTLKATPETHEESTRNTNAPKDMDSNTYTNAAPVDKTEIETNLPAHAHNSTITRNGTLNHQKCYDCTSTHDKLCVSKPTNEKTCKEILGSENGCYTLLRVDTNVTIRGCISDLAEEGLKYCSNKTTLCNLCFEPICNYRKAPTSAGGCMSVLISLIILAAVLPFCLK